MTRWTAHAAACARGDDSYVDPETGYRVFTEVGLKARGRCCGCGCRHCPFEHTSVPGDQLGARIQRPAWLHGAASHSPVDALFWSGGKDSLLALRALERDQAAVVLITTFDAGARQVAHQEIGIDQVVRQARHLGLPLLGVPLHGDRLYLDQVREGLDLVPALARLAFGDLHLEHIRTWREANLGPIAASRGASLHYPIWQVPYAELMDDLERSGVPCVVCAVPDPTTTGVTVGTPFGRELVAGLPPTVDAFGENGEFHTLAQLWGAPGPRG